MSLPCPSCGTAYAEDVATCPYCRAPREAGGLARGDLHLDALVSGSLARLTDPLADRGESLGLLTRALEQDLAGPLAPRELEAALTRSTEAAAPSLDDLEGLLALDGAAPAIALDGIQLGALVDRGGDVAQILRRGLTFMKRGKFPEAAEWWSLHRSQLDPTRQRLELLLLLLEAFTHSLNGDQSRAAAVRAQIRKHPLYLELRGRAPLARP